jgi:hypothetical protein
MLRLVVPILKLKDHDEKREIDFTISCYKQMTADQLFQMMFEKSRLMKELLSAHGHSQPCQIIKRK